MHEVVHRPSSHENLWGAKNHARGEIIFMHENSIFMHENSIFMHENFIFMRGYMKFPWMRISFLCRK